MSSGCCQQYNDDLLPDEEKYGHSQWFYDNDENMFSTSIEHITGQEKAKMIKNQVQHVQDHRSTRANQ